MAKKGLFITLEGTDGVGKTTHALLLSNWLESLGRKVTLTREPGGGPVAEKIRRILLDPGLHMEDSSELFLYLAARIDHVRHVIMPALKSNHIVICDRFADATMAYQGYARKLPLDLIQRLNHIATNGLKPALTLLLDLPPKIGLKKAWKAKPHQKRGDRLEKEGLAFQQRVRQGYLALAKKEPHRVKRVKVEGSIPATQNNIRQIVLKWIKK